MNNLHRKSILIVSGVFAPEPITSAMMNFDLADKLGENNNVTVLAPKPSRPKGFDFDKTLEPKGNFKLIRCNSYICPQSDMLGRFKESNSFGKVCVKYIEEHHSEIDFIYNDGWQLFGLYLVAKACVKYGIPYIVPIQDIYPESLMTKLPKIPFIKSIVKSILSPMDNYYIRNAYKVRTISDGMADYLSSTRKINRDKFLVVANWQDDSSFESFKNSDVSRENGIKFMFLGNNNKQANVDLMIKAFDKAKIPNSSLYLMGGGSAKSDCMKFVKDQNIHNVYFDTVPNGKIAEVQSKADVMILALKTGTGKLGIPSKLTAYMLSGKPVIASVESDSDTAQIIKSSSSGFVTRPDDIDELCMAMKKMAGLSSLELKNMGENSLQFAKEKLSRRVNLELVCKIIGKK